MASFQIISDLHLETPSAYDVYDIPPKASYLALLGDIGNVRDDGLFTFIEAQLRKFQVVFFVLGNHEPFHSSWSAVKERIKEFSNNISCKKAQETQTGSGAMGKFVFLDRTRYDISPDVTVLGCTFYSKVIESQEDQVNFRLNDFYYIEDWTVTRHCAAHDADRDWLNEQVSQIAKSNPHQKIVIFTHHSPTVHPKSLDPVHAHDTHVAISSAFSTDLTGEDCWEKPQVRLWAFGHTHYNCDFIETRTGKRVLANQRGYYFAQSKGFDPEMVVRI